MTHIEILCIFECLLHDALIEEFIRLHPQGMHRRPLARIQQAALDGCPVRCNPHLPAERVDLAHEMALAGAADGRIARHHRDVVEREREDECPAPHPRRRKSCLNARMPCADDDNIIVRSAAQIDSSSAFILKIVMLFIVECVIFSL